MALTIAGTGTSQNNGASTSPLSVTFSCPTGFRIGDGLYIVINGGSAVNGESHTDDGREWFEWEISSWGSGAWTGTGMSCTLEEYGVVSADTDIIGQTSFTFTWNSTGAYGITGTGLMAVPGIVVRGGVGYGSEHHGAATDKNTSASGISPRTASIGTHSGETGASGKQILIIGAGRMDKASSTVTDLSGNMANTMGSVIRSDNQDSGIWGGYEILAEGVSAEPAFTLIGSWTGGGSTTINAGRVVMLWTLESPPTAAFTHTENHLYIEIDMSGSSDPEDTVTTEWEVDWGDGNSDGVYQTGSQTYSSHVYAAAGTYTVGVTVYDSIGVSDLIEHDVTVTAEKAWIPTQEAGYKIDLKVKIPELPYDIKSGMFGDEL